MTATFEFRTVQFLFEFLPMAQLPSVHLEFFHVVAEVGHVFGGECLI